MVVFSIQEVIKVTVPRVQTETEWELNEPLNRLESMMYRLNEIARKIPINKLVVILSDELKKRELVGKLREKDWTM